MIFPLYLASVLVAIVQSSFPDGYFDNLPENPCTDPNCYYKSDVGLCFNKYTSRRCRNKKITTTTTSQTTTTTAVKSELDDSDEKHVRSTTKKPDREDDNVSSTTKTSFSSTSSTSKGKAKLLVTTKPDSPQSSEQGGLDWLHQLMMGIIATLLAAICVYFVMKRRQKGMVCVKGRDRADSAVKFLAVDDRQDSWNTE